MFDWIPLPVYSLVFIVLMLVVTLLIFFISTSFPLESRVNRRFLNAIEFILILFVPLYIGERPVSGAFFGDMYIYSWDFKNYRIFGSSYMLLREPVWDWYMYTCSKIMSEGEFFLLTAYIYVLPMYFVCKKLFKKYSLIAFFFFLASFSFWSYGTNGLRNGVATSLFLLVFITNKRWKQLLIMFVSYHIHKSVIMPALAFWIVQFVQNPNLLLNLWLTSIAVSYLLGDSIQTLFGGLMDDNRSAYLLDASLDKGIVVTGFRWDFIIYSSFAIFLGWYYIVKRNFNDRFYYIIWGTYLISNIIWIMVIRAAYSNRFAYLSWFLMALVFIYPMLKKYIVPNQYRTIGFMGLAYFGFTIIMYFIG